MKPDLLLKAAPSGRQRRQPNGPAHTRNNAVDESKGTIAKLDDALKDLGDRSALSRSPLARLGHVQGVAADKYSDRIMPRGLALRQVITECVARICAELGDEPGLAKPCRYLDLRAKGLKCTEVAAQLGRSLEATAALIHRGFTKLQEFLSEGE